MSIFTRTSDAQKAAYAESQKPTPAPAALTASPKPGLSATDVARLLADAESQVSAAEKAHGAAALEAVSGGDATSGELATAAQALADARQRVSTLTAALQVAKERDAMARRAAIASLQRTQLRACKSHLDARGHAADAVEVAISNLADAWDVLVRRSEKAKAACPGGELHWPAGSLCSFGELKELAARELYRRMGNPEIGAHQFPGASPGSLDYQQRPDKLPPMADEIKRASAHVLAVLNGKIVG